MNSTRQHRPQPDLELPNAFETSGTGLVSLHLDLVGGATIDELQAALSTKKVTLYSLLRTLTATGLFDREGTEHARQERTSEGGDR
jgi:hypothetical protein